MIKFVRQYKWYGRDSYDVVYQSGRIVIYDVPERIPATVVRFMESATVRHSKCPVYGHETIYE